MCVKHFIIRVTSRICMQIMEISHSHSEREWERELKMQKRISLDGVVVVGEKGSAHSTQHGVWGREIMKICCICIPIAISTWRLFYYYFWFFLFAHYTNAFFLSVWCTNLYGSDTEINKIKWISGWSSACFNLKFHLKLLKNKVTITAENCLLLL